MKIKRVLKWSIRAILAALILAFLVGFIAYWRSTNECDRQAAAPANPMKAVRNCEYGSPDVLQLDVVEKPVPDDDQILVKVRANAINAADGHGLRGGYLPRLFGGLRKPKDTRFGLDYAGTVEAVGRNVTQFKPGDEVFGGKNGAMAEYLCARADRGVVLKPANLTFEQAAAVPVAAITALQGLRDKGKIQAGQKVLINGASGGVGTFAVQIAKSFGAEVTGVCSTRNVEMVRSLGADHVIDYTKEDFTKGAKRYDVIFDLVGNHSFSDRRRVLQPKGICVLAGVGGSGSNDGQMGSRLLGMLRALVSSPFVSQKFVFYIAQLNKADLEVLSGLMQSGKITPVIDREYNGLGEAVEAVRYLEQGRARGKVVVRVEPMRPPSQPASN
ncbi:MAG TPA: NAD(P)-dependent alcohol dehydrogenase [Pyrinomonadaceae bacterium]|nr:NAD(P)-dependent alcohol dehydrogenase [Pyrinomonadaceae bacterium]